MRAKLVTTLILLVFFHSIEATKYPNRSVCAVRSCVNETTEVERWKCVGNYLFRPDHHLANGRFVEHPCEGLGWGNSISSLSIAAELAAILDARIIFKRKFSLLWDIPQQYFNNRSMGVVAWDYMTLREKVSSWRENLTTSESALGEYNNKRVDTGICASDAGVLVSGNCITSALPTFAKCLHHLPDVISNMPIFFAAFQRPSPALNRHLATIRERLSLPPLPPGLEPHPGSWGLYTPGYYLFALHFRMIPLGFEPMSAMLSEGAELERRLDALPRFWRDARAHAARARAVAACRGEALLIYLATDDPANLRPAAAAQLGEFGRVVWGLEEGEVGHISPMWTPEREREVDARTAAILARRAAPGAPPPCAGEPAPPADDAGSCTAAALRPPHLAGTARGGEAARRHGDMALAEWWVLANAQWLAAPGGSSFSRTAAAWGLGPGGRMERFDAGWPVLRVDWDAPPCAFVGAADPAQAARCPNRLDG